MVAKGSANLRALMVRDIGVAVGRGVGNTTTAGVAVGTGLGNVIGVAVGNGVGKTTTAGVAVGTGLGSANGVAVGSGVGNTIGVAVGAGVAVGNGVGNTTDCAHATTSTDANDATSSSNDFNFQGSDLPSNQYSNSPRLRCRGLRDCFNLNANC